MLMRKWILPGAAIVAAIALGVYILVQVGVFDTWIHGDDRLIGERAAPFALKTYDGETIRFPDLHERVTLIVFWSPT